MIIVSQEKNSIINFNNISSIELNEFEDEGWIIKCNIIDNSYINLAIYKTKERAKEVLQEIVDFYEISERYECSSNSGLTLFIKKTFVYEMPKE